MYLQNLKENIKISKYSNPGLAVLLFTCIKCWNITSLNSEGNLYCNISSSSEALLNRRVATRQRVVEDFLWVVEDFGIFIFNRYFYFKTFVSSNKLKNSESSKKILTSNISSTFILTFDMLVNQIKDYFFQLHLQNFTCFQTNVSSFLFNKRENISLCIFLRISSVQFFFFLFSTLPKNQPKN